MYYPQKLYKQGVLCYNGYMMIRKDNILLRAMFLLSLSILLSGCSNNIGVFNAKQRVEPPIYSSFKNIDLEEIDNYSIAKYDAKHSDVYKNLDIETVLANNERSKSNNRRNCRITDRFDRKLLLSYEQDGGNTKYGFDIDGLLSTSGKKRNIVFSYKKKLNASAIKKKPCRFNSNLQGLLGSVYNEVFLRKNDTVWGDIKDLRNEIEQNINMLLH